jgi:hypothetical protein
MSNHPVFNNTCFDADSTLFIPTFRSLWKPISNNNETMSHRLGSEKPGKQEAHKKLKARKAELRKFIDNDDVFKYDKNHVANLLSRTSPATLADCDHDIVITAIAHMQLPLPPLPTSPHPTPPFKQAKHGCITSQMPALAPSELNK